jgi:hypothetical protein
VALVASERLSCLRSHSGGPVKRLRTWQQNN